MTKVTERQLKQMAKLFRLSGRTFQSAAREAGLENIPDHVDELTKEEAKRFLNYFGVYFIGTKDKQ